MKNIMLSLIISCLLELTGCIDNNCDLTTLLNDHPNVLASSSLIKNQDILYLLQVTVKNDSTVDASVLIIFKIELQDGKIEYMESRTFVKKTQKYIYQLPVTFETLFHHLYIVSIIAIDN